MMHKARPITNDEARDIFLRHVAGLVEYWDGQPGTQQSKLRGLAFSILAAVDGSSVGLPGYHLIPMTSPENEQHAKDCGYDYYPASIDRRLALIEDRVRAYVSAKETAPQVAGEAYRDLCAAMWPDGYPENPFAQEMTAILQEQHSMDLAGDLHERIHAHFRGEVPRPEGLRTFGNFLADEARGMPR